MSFFEVVLLFIAITVSVINMKSLYYNFSRLLYAVETASDFSL